MVKDAIIGFIMGSGLVVFIVVNLDSMIAGFEINPVVGVINFLWLCLWVGFQTVVVALIVTGIAKGIGKIRKSQ